MNEHFNPLDHPIVLSLPKRNANSAWTEYVPLGMLLVQLSKPSLLVELGVHNGVSYCAFCEAVREASLNTLCYGIDHWKGDDHAGVHSEAVYTELKEYHDPLYSDFSTLIRTSFDEAIVRFKNSSIDFLHIDGYHTYESVKHDFETWLPKMSDRGIIIFHDINVQNTDFGVWKLWAEIKEQYTTMEFFNDYGLGIALVGHEIPTSLTPLLNSFIDNSAHLRRYFGALSERIRIYRQFAYLTAIMSQQEKNSHEQLSQLEQQYQQKLATQFETERMEWQAHVFQIQNESTTANQALEQQYKQQIRELEQQWQQQIRNLQEQNKRQITELEQQSQQQILRLEQQEQQQIRDLQEQNKRQVTELEQQRRQQTTHLDQVSFNYQDTQSELQRMRSTRGWKTLESWWKFKNRFLYSHKTTNRLKQLCKTSLYILRYDGLISFIGRLIKWLRGERRFYLAGKSVVMATSQPEYNQLDLPIQNAQNPQFSVLYITVGTLILSKRYRIFNVKEQLAKHGIPVSVIDDVEVIEKKSWVLSFDIIVIARTIMVHGLKKVLDEAKSKNIQLVFEIDDYVFDEEVLPLVDAIKDFGKPELQQYIDGIHKYREMLLYCDSFIGSTKLLADKATELGKKSYIIRNGLNDEQIRIADDILATSKPASNVVTIGYLSGTATHQKDFMIVAAPILRILEQFDNVMLVIRGYLTVPPILKKVENQIRIEPFVSWQELTRVTAKLDINIAPLEINDFTEAKSALKYFEAALVQVPTIASPTEDFKFAIRHGYNGFLAHTEEEWYRCLYELVQDSSLRKRSGLNARQDALDRFTSDAQSKHTLDVFREIFTSSRTTKHLDITWVLSRPALGSGGHRMVIHIAALLEKLGHKCTVHIIDDGFFGSEYDLLTFLDQHFELGSAKYLLGTENILPCDIMIATIWHSAYIVNKNRHNARQVCYFVQDFEPYFYPMGLDFIQAENSYQLGLNHITIGTWLATLLTEKFGAKAKYFQFPIDHSVYRIIQTGAVRKSILYFARPEMPRRCYVLGIDVLNLLCKRDPSIEIFIFGSREIDSKSIPFPHQNLGVVQDIKQLALLYNKAKIGLAFSTTNPSVVPFEMMACGCPVVDLEYGDNYINYGSRENVTLVPTDPHLACELVYQLLNDKLLSQAKTQKGLNFVKDFPTIEDAARVIEKILIGYLNDS